MKKFKIVFYLLLVASVISCDYATIHKEDFQKVCEKFYFEGQKDAINNDVKIKLNSDSVYIWVKSPWDDNETPIYNPTYLESK